MELGTHSHRWQARAPDWLAAGIAGFVAGAALMVLELIWAPIANSANLWTTTYRVAAISMGEETLRLTGFHLLPVVVALITHYVLGILFGLVLGAIMAPFRLDSGPALAAIIGLVFGLVLYLVNFHGMVYFFPWFADMRGGETVIAHMIFGVVGGLLYWQLERPEYAH